MGRGRGLWKPFSGFLFVFTEVLRDFPIIRAAELERAEPRFARQISQLLKLNATGNGR